MASAWRSADRVERNLGTTNGLVRAVAPHPARDGRVVDADAARAEPAPQLRSRAPLVAQRQEFMRVAVEPRPCAASLPRRPGLDSQARGFGRRVERVLRRCWDAPGRPPGGADDAFCRAGSLRRSHSAIVDTKPDADNEFMVSAAVIEVTGRETRKARRDAFGSLDRGTGAFAAGEGWHPRGTDLRNINAAMVSIVAPKDARSPSHLPAWWRVAARKGFAAPTGPASPLTGHATPGGASQRA